MNTISGTGAEGTGAEGTGAEGTGAEGTGSADSDISTAANKNNKKNINQIYLNRHINFMMQPNTFQ
jgi:hypothetical protein